MTVAYCKEVSPAVFTKMGKDKVRVLIDFVGVLWTEASLGCKWKLSHAVVKFLCCWIIVTLSLCTTRRGVYLLSSGNLSSNWSSNWTVSIVCFWLIRLMNWSPLLLLVFVRVISWVLTIMVYCCEVTFVAFVRCCCCRTWIIHSILTELFISVDFIRSNNLHRVYWLRHIHLMWCERTQVTFLLDLVD